VAGFSVGQYVTWPQDDDMPHQSTLTGAGDLRSDVMLKGQSATLKFDAAGNIAYICGLHPTMKGTIEVVAEN
jgi:plastocyanin